MDPFTLDPENPFFLSLLAKGLLISAPTRSPQTCTIGGFWVQGLISIAEQPCRVTIYEGFERLTLVSIQALTVILQGWAHTLRPGAPHVSGLLLRMGVSQNQGYHSFWGSQ